MLKNAYIKGTTRAHKKLIIMVLIPSSNNKRKKPFMLVVGPPDSLVINNKNSLKFLSTTKWTKPKTKRLYSLAKLASQYKYVISVF